MALLRRGLIGATLLLAACTATSTTSTTSAADSDGVAEPAATTMVVEPTSPATPTVSPAPRPTSAQIATPRAASTAEPGPAKGDPLPNEAAGPLPILVDPPASLTNLIGTVYEGQLPELDAQLAAVVGGGAIINTGEADELWHGLAYLVEGEHVHMGISALIDRTDEGKAIWRLDSVWALQLAPDSLITIGNEVCKAQEPTHDYGTALFLAVTNNEQDTALGAWVITVEGPTRYEAFADLDCERFIP